MENVIAAHQDPAIVSFEAFRSEVLSDYRKAYLSRQVSLLGRREVLTGKAKFGIFGDGKELPQVALAKFFRPGDWRSGYYRDQTWMFALGMATVQQFFAQIYGDPDVQHDPWSAGRQMNAHFMTRNVDADGQLLPLAHQYNTATDMAPTAAQMPRALGLALASKSFRQLPELAGLSHLSQQGNEVCFCSIGDASTSEGHFWETMNAACVLQVPLAVFVWDDGYGISVPKEYQTTKGSISEAMKGFQKMEGTNGMHIYKVKAWDYAGMCEAFEEGLTKCRQQHVPVLFHVEEVTQPQGHSTSGSHERYKSAERLAWEREWDCIKKFREWIEANELVSAEELEALELDVKNEVKQGKDAAWQQYHEPVKQLSAQVQALLQQALQQHETSNAAVLEQALSDLQTNKEVLRRDVGKALATGIDFATGHSLQAMQQLRQQWAADSQRLYSSHLYNEGPASALRVQPVPATYSAEAPTLNGYEV
nr:thiamine pyrophosphate-dependent dehydrogenase E1 component subunit alpha [Chitinophagaceae bacterium]